MALHNIGCLNFCERSRIESDALVDAVIAVNYGNIHTHFLLFPNSHLQFLLLPSDAGRAAMCFLPNRREMMDCSTISSERRAEGYQAWAQHSLFLGVGIILPRSRFYNPDFQTTHLPLHVMDAVYGARLSVQEMTASLQDLATQEAETKGSAEFNPKQLMLQEFKKLTGQLYNRNNEPTNPFRKGLKNLAAN